MTRAVHALHMIIAPAKASEKQMPKTFAGLLRATLAPDQPAAPEVMLYEHGDPRWFRGKVAGTLRVPLAADDTRSLPATISLAPTAGQRQRGLDRASPSALEGGTKIAAAMVLAEKPEAAYGVGTLFHAWLAQVRWLDDGPPDDEVLRQVADRLRGELPQAMPRAETLIPRFRQLLSAGPVAQVLSRRYYETPAACGLAKMKRWPAAGITLDVHCERPFAIRRGDQILKGSIDRLIIVRSGGQPIAADIIDFKTDEIAKSDAKQVREKTAFYQPQIDAYRAAVARLLGLDLGQIAARLVFLGAGRVETV
jgi:ATP-dependent exoDNAse (exonuclease V) beta subunit